MDPSMLVERSAEGLPAPVWFVQFFKVLGFTLHAAAMNLWYAGLPIALWLHLRGGEGGRRFGGRLLRQMPVIVALGVNLGIVPLLFVQLAYHQVFYPATILMAWFWLAIIALLIPAYYGIYLYAWGNKGVRNLLPERRADNSAEKVPDTFFAWCAALLFLAIGFIFVNGLSLMDHVHRWPELWNDHHAAGAALGTALNVGDATLWPRWLLMLGLAVQTTAAWALLDAEWLGGKVAVPADAKHSANGDYRGWAWGFALKLYTVGLVWFAAAGSWYVFGTWSAELREAMFRWPLLAITVPTALAPGLPWLLILVGRRLPGRRAVAALIALGQFGVLAVNAVSRQTVQNVNLKPYSDVLAIPENVQWGPLVMFLATFGVGLAVIGWMIAQLRKCDSV